MSADPIPAIRERLAARTPGEWHTVACPSGSGIDVTSVDSMAPVACIDGRDAPGGLAADAEFIAHAPADIAWLLAENDALRAAVDAVLALHSLGTTLGLCTGEEIAICRGCGAGPHPCDTVRALTTHLPDVTKET